MDDRERRIDSIMDRGKSEADVVIISAGLSGLTLAYLLRKSGRKVLLLEARSRLGGKQIIAK